MEIPRVNIQPPIVFVAKTAICSRMLVTICSRMDYGKAPSATACAVQQPRPLTLHLKQLFHGHHMGTEIRHDDHRAEDDQTHDEDAEGERQHDIRGIG